MSVGFARFGFDIVELVHVLVVRAWVSKCENLSCVTNEGRVASRDHRLACTTFDGGRATDPLATPARGISQLEGRRRGARRGAGERRVRAAVAPSKGARQSAADRGWSTVLVHALVPLAELSVLLSVVLSAPARAAMALAASTLLGSVLRGVSAERTQLQPFATSNQDVFPDVVSVSLGRGRPLLWRAVSGPEKSPSPHSFITNISIPCSIYKLQQLENSFGLDHLSMEKAKKNVYKNKSKRGAPSACCK